MNSTQPDFINEHAGDGNDTIRVPFTGSSTFHAWFDYTLIKGSTFTTAHVKNLVVHDSATTYAVNLQGDLLNNEIRGNDGQNILDGWTGADTLVGLGGDNIYYVDNAGDVVTEAAGEGSDTVYLHNPTFGVNPNLTAFTLPDDVERLFAAAGNVHFTLTGNALDNEIGGNSGNNFIDGQLGNDILTGLGGADTFAFTTALGGNNVDQLIGFQVGTDRIAARQRDLHRARARAVARRGVPIRRGGAGWG